MMKRLDNQHMKLKAVSFRKASITLLVALAVTLSGCETTNPFTGEKEVNKTSQGAIIGAVGGAIAGGIFSGRSRTILLSAGVAALAGGLVGNYMDKEDAKLRAKLQGTGVSVTRTGDRITLNMPGNVTFASNSSNISADFYAVLDSVVLVLNEFDQTYIDVVGHTDSTGSKELNQRLSEQRATSVARYLNSHKVLTERIIARGVGPGSPVASNETAEGRALNRRVEIVLTPVT